MQAVVKMPHIEITIKGMISDSVLNLLRKEYGSNFEIIDDEIPVNIFETEWYKTIKSGMKPGDFIRAHRGKRGWTQEELGAKLGGIPKQHVSNMERGSRRVSLKMAQKLAVLFDTDIGRFLVNQ